MSLCIDNGAMIAAAGISRLKHGLTGDFRATPNPNLPLFTAPPKSTREGEAPAEPEGSRAEARLGRSLALPIRPSGESLRDARADVSEDGFR